MAGEHITQEQADEYAIGALEEQADRAVSLHLLECEPCRDLVANAQLVAASFALGSHIAPPPRSLRRRVFETTGIARPSLITRATRFGAAAAVIAALVVAAAALTGMVTVRSQVRDLRDANAALDSRVREAMSTKVEVAALSAKLDEAEATAARLQDDDRLNKDILLALMSGESQVIPVWATGEGNATGRLIWDKERQTLWFVAVGLPSLANGEVYRIWLNSGGSYVSIGSFNSDNTGLARYEAIVSSNLADYDAAVITIESANSTTVREGQAVFVPDLTTLR